MQHVLVSDTSVLIDLKRGSLLEASFRLPYRFIVPDLLYERELKNFEGEELLQLGLTVEELNGEDVQRALAFRQRVPALSIPDCFALVLAQTQSSILLSSDRALRQLADDESVECHGVLWLLDEMPLAPHAGDFSFLWVPVRMVAETVDSSIRDYIQRVPRERGRYAESVHFQKSPPGGYRCEHGRHSHCWWIAALRYQSGSPGLMTSSRSASKAT